MTRFKCLYCGSLFNVWFTNTPRCPTCNDSNVKPYKEVDKSNVYGYPQDIKLEEVTDDKEPDYGSHD